MTDSDKLKALAKWFGKQHAYIHKGTGSPKFNIDFKLCIKGGERLDNGECSKCNLLWGKSCADQ